MRRDLKIKTIDVVIEQFCNRIGKEAWADLRRELVEEKFISTNKQSTQPLCRKCKYDGACDLQDTQVNLILSCGNYLQS